MELGRLPEMDNAQVNHVSKTEKVNEVDNKHRVVPDEQYKNAKSNEVPEDINEVVLDNVRFGYNKSSRDFFVKVTRGDAEYKFPTEDMMRVKAHLIAEMETQINNNK